VIIGGVTSWSWVLQEKPPVAQISNNFPFYGTRKFITVFTRARHWSRPWAKWILSIPPHPISLRSILTLFCHLRLGLPNGLFSSGFPTKTLYEFIFAPMRATCPAHLILLGLTILIVFVKGVPCHHGMARHQVADGGAGLQIWREAEIILNKQSRMADKGWYSSLGVGLITPDRNKHFVKKCYTGPWTWVVIIGERRIMQFSPTSYHFIALRSK
jgi:hypothetical protein